MCDMNLATLKSDDLSRFLDSESAACKEDSAVIQKSQSAVQGPQSHSMETETGKGNEYHTVQAGFVGAHR